MAASLSSGLSRERDQAALLVGDALSNRAEAAAERLKPRRFSRCIGRARCGSFSRREASPGRLNCPSESPGTIDSRGRRRPCRRSSPCNIIESGTHDKVGNIYTAFYEKPRAPAGPR